MYDKDRLAASLKRYEGLRLTAYKDSVGVLTIGYGHNLEHLTISQERADTWLNEDMVHAAEQTYDAFPWLIEHSDLRQEVVINMVFNMGLSRFKGFKNMIAAMQEGDYERTADEMLDSKWAEQVGYRADELAYTMRLNIIPVEV